MKTRVCSDCKVRKELAAFSKSKSRLDGIAYVCKKCMVARVRAWTLTNPERVRDNQNRWRAKNKDKLRARSRARYAKHAVEERAKARAKHNTPEGRARARRDHLRRMFKMTPEQWDTMFAEQNSACACCGSARPSSKRGWHTDHDHKTGLVRGIVCHPCNMMIGGARDSIEILEAGKRYLSKC